MHQNFLKLFVKNKVSLTVSKLQLNCMLPQGGESSLNLTAGLRRTIGKYMPFCKLIVIFRPACRLTDLFRFKDSLKRKIFSGAVYLYACSNFKVTNYGITSPSSFC